VSLYLDASAIVPTLVNEPSSAAIRQFLKGATDQFIVGGLAAIEVSSAISRLVRMNLSPADDGEALLADFDQWRSVHSMPDDPSIADLRLADQFVRRFELALRAPDAVHLAVCRRGDHTLVTLDKRLAAAAEALGVRAIRPG
jgi:hypothetical protein